MGSPAQHSREFWDQKARGRHGSIQHQEGLGQLQLSSLGRTGQAQSSGKRQRKGQGGDRTVLDRCSLKYLEGANMERRQDLFREPQGRAARKEWDKMKKKLG